MDERDKVKYYKCDNCGMKGVHQIRYKCILNKYIGRPNPTDAECKYCKKEFNDKEFSEFLRNIKSEV